MRKSLEHAATRTVESFAAIVEHCATLSDLHAEDDTFPTQSAWDADQAFEAELAA